MTLTAERPATTDIDYDFVPLGDIVIHGGTQPRASLSQDTIAEYSEALREGAHFPPVVLFYDGGQYWLADGFHRYHAHKLAELTEINAEVHQGDRRAAVLYSIGANADHGLRRSNGDKRRSVMVLLKDEEWSQWSDREIARRAKVSHQFVSNLRKELSVNGLQMPAERKVERNGTVYVQNTEKIGTAKPETQTHSIDEEIRRVWAMIKKYTISIDPAVRLRVLQQHKDEVFDTSAYDKVFAELTGQINHQRRTTAKTAAQEAGKPLVEWSKEDWDEYEAADGPAQHDGAGRPTEADPSITVADAETLIRRALAERDDHPELEAYKGAGWALYLKETYNQWPLIDVARQAILSVQRTPTVKAVAAEEQPKGEHWRIVGERGGFIAVDDERQLATDVWNSPEAARRAAMGLHTTKADYRRLQDNGHQAQKVTVVATDDEPQGLNIQQIERLWVAVHNALTCLEDRAIGEFAATMHLDGSLKKAIAFLRDAHGVIVKERAKHREGAQS